MDCAWTAAPWRSRRGDRAQFIKLMVNVTDPIREEADLRGCSSAVKMYLRMFM